jgi:hypothetical protein
LRRIRSSPADQTLKPGRIGDMLRVLHVAPFPAIDGADLAPISLPLAFDAGEQAKNLAHRQARASGRVTALFTRGTRRDVPTGTEERVETDGLLTVLVHLGPERERGHQRTRWGIADRFRRFVADWKPDVVHFHHLLYHSLDYPAIARKAGAATVLTLHDYWFTCPAATRKNYLGVSCERATGRACLPCVWGGQGGGERLPQESVARLAFSPAAKLLNLIPITDEMTDWADNTQHCLDAMDMVISCSPIIAADLRRNGVSHPNVVVSDAPAGEVDIAEMDALYAQLRPQTLAA